MIRNNTLFSSIIFCNFLDSGPNAIDYFFDKEYNEKPDITAMRLMTKTTLLIKGDENQTIEQSIVGQLNGPDIFPLDAQYKMIWYNWLVENKFSNDVRINKSGSLAGIYCVFNKKYESTIRDSLKIIEDVLNTFTEEFKSINSIISNMLDLSSNIKVTREHYDIFLQNKNKYVIVKQIDSLLKENIRKRLPHQIKYTEQTKIFKKIYEILIINKGTSDEIKGSKTKKILWKSLMKNLNQQIYDNIPKIKIKKNNKDQIKDIHFLFMNDKIWLKLPLKFTMESFNKFNENDISNFFFYYWLSNHKLLKKNQILDYYVNVAVNKK